MEKKCFIIMPISDQEGYENGHFHRVYKHLIKPACERAGFIPIRADEENKTNYIVIDIIRKILEAHIVLCDLSAKNPNVLYELGLRQAFNKKSVLIKDNKTNRIFDIQGLRTIDYDDKLRIDEVETSIANISKTLIETYESDSEEINSLIQLLAIRPAVIPNNIEISKESSLILESLTDIANRLTKLEKNDFTKSKNSVNSKRYDINKFKISIGEDLYNGKGILIGQLADVHDDAIFVKRDDSIIKILKSDPSYSTIDNLPF
jgi:hypothetical protein